MTNIWGYLKNNYHLAFFLFLGLVSFWGAAVYLGYNLSIWGVILTLFLALASAFFIIRHLSQARQDRVEIEARVGRPWWLGLYAVLFIVFSWLVVSSRTGRSLVSPFEVLPEYILGFYFVLSLVAFIFFYLEAKYSFWVLLAQLILSFSLLPLIYSAGYGYDPFLHRAALKAIDLGGAIYPKTIYYSGQYSLEIILHRLTRVDLRWIDTFLLPFLAAVSVALISLSWRENKNRFFSLGLLLLWPFSFLTYTVPQNLAYLFLGLVVLLSLNRRKEEVINSNLWAMVALSLAALFIQPFAGIAAVVFTAALIAKKFSRYYFWLFAGQAIFWPVFFWFFLPVRFSLPAFNFSFSGANDGYWFDNLIYLWQVARSWLLVLLAAVMIFWSYKKKPLLRPHVLAFGSLVLAYGACLFLPLTNLAVAEKYDYAERLLVAATLFLLPGCLWLGEVIKEKMKIERLAFKVIIFIGLALLLSASFYLAYPRNDVHFNSKGYSVSVSDLHATSYINQAGQGRDYIVLANQQVGAAAISQFGFYKYYGPNFYYSTQSGGPLQTYFRELMATPTKATVISAMNLAGVSEVYVVVNNYWWDFDRVVKLLQYEADGFAKIDNGEDYVFWFTK